MSNETLFQAYSPLPAAKRFSGLPRFGHTSDFSALFGTQEESDDYSVGLIFAGCLVVTFFILWIVVLLVFCCMGQRRVGFLAGSPFRRPHPEPLRSEMLEDRQENYSEPDHDDKPIGRESARLAPTKKSGGLLPFDRPTRVRAVFLSAGVVYIIFSFLLVTQGITNLQTTIDTLNSGSRQVQELTVEAAQILNEGLRELGEIAKSVRAELSDQFSAGNFCPADPLLENSQVGQDIFGQATDAIRLLDEVGDFATDNITSLEDSVVRVQSGATDVVDATDDIDVNDWEALIFLVPYIVVPVFLMAAVVMSFFDVTFPYYNCVVTWFLFPFFTVLTVVAFVITFVMTIAAGMNSDWCVPGGQNDASPDQTILRILEAEGYDADSKIMEIVTFYVDKCTSTEDPFLFLKEYLTQIIDSNVSLDQLEAAIGDPTILGELTLYCGREFSPLVALLGRMREIVDVLRSAATRTLALVGCDRIVPIYTDVAYSATCDYSVKAVSWVFASTLIIGICGMIMITCRAAYKSTVYYDPNKEIDADVLVNNGLELQENNQQVYPYNGEQEPYAGEHYIQEVPAAPQVEDYGLDESFGVQKSSFGSPRSAHIY